ncbi:MAG TPA: LytTR family DNA-binding domain-containing protein [Gemmatimonadales bacterium]|jgi:two-component system LytT family response regulator|nr:LytTR family DNA-binding domain-containing protein [Gemmatimonadales bacterium]
MTGIRALIVDDEALARERIRTLLAVAPDVSVVGECTGGREAVEAVLAQRPDLMFLDVQMPDLDGFGVLEAVAGDWMPAVVFVTAYDEYALRAFDVHALDYVLKPIEPDRFARALAQVRARLGDARDQRLVDLLDALARRETPLDRVVIRTRDRVSLLKPGDIDWIEADGKRVRLHVGRETHVVRQQLGNLERRLAGHGFVRVHRSAIVNVDRIRHLEPWFHGEYVILLADGTRLTSSAAHSEALHRMIQGAP